jgi:hypothetical protein
MAFNFERYTSNNPLLHEIEEEVTVSSSGVQMEEADQYPLVGIETAVLNAIKAGVDKQTVINIVNQTYGGSTEDGNYTSSEEFDYMDDDQLDNAGLTGNKNLGPNK